MLTDKNAWTSRADDSAPSVGVVLSRLDGCASGQGSVECENKEAGRHNRFTGSHASKLTVQCSPVNAVSRRSAVLGSLTCEIVEANQRVRIETRFCAPVHMLAVHERGMRQDGGTYIAGLSKSTTRDCRRKFVFVPAGHEYYDWHDPLTLSRVAYFYFDPAHLAPELGPSTVSSVPRLFFEDYALWDTCLKLIALIDHGGPEHRVYVKALGVVLAHDLARLDSERHRADAPVRGCLASWQKQRVVAYIGEHLAAPIPLATLARLVRLSPSYFCRAFRQSFGVPPQRYQIVQRIERAKTLLAAQAASVTDIGLTVGYGETSAFSTAFRRVTGLTPTAYRRSAS
jgi:AraC family transcriptional regulator